MLRITTSGNTGGVKLTVAPSEKPTEIIIKFEKSEVISSTKALIFDCPKEQAVIVRLDKDLILTKKREDNYGNR